MADYFTVRNFAVMGLSYLEYHPKIGTLPKLELPIHNLNSKASHSDLQLLGSAERF